MAIATLIAVSGDTVGSRGIESVSHEQLWAPWRIGYIRGEMEKEAPAETGPLDFLPGADPDCFLCQCVADTTDDHGRGVVLRGGCGITVLNRYPYNNGHLLVAPCRHVGRLDELLAEEQLELSRTIAQMVAVLEKVIQPQGFNVGLNLGRAAGAGLPGHLHWHIVPRWIGDTNFMPMLADVNVIPQSLDALWELLTHALAGSSMANGQK
jgi:ATP adenylyltransferase